MSVVGSLVSSDCEKGGLANSSGKEAKNNGNPEAKATAALKSHREAERRRRDRINAHLATLRGLVSSDEKMDKAALLAEVINQVKQLKKTATQATEGLHLPMEINEVKVEKLEENAADGTFLLRASLCCEYRPDLLSDLSQAILKLPICLIKSEISTLGGRIKTVFLLSIIIEEGDNNAAETPEVVIGCVHSTLSSILEKVTASAEYAQQLSFTQKRQRVSYFGSSCSTV